MVLVSLRLVCLVLGIIGYVIPGLLGTIWLIIAATLFIRSSDRLYRLVIQNRLFGQQAKEFLETEAIPVRAKAMSIASICIFSVTSLFLAPYGWLLDMPILLLAIIGTIYIISKPTRGERSSVQRRAK